TERPAASNQITGSAAPKKIAYVCGKERDPHRNQPALERNTLGNQIDGKPVGDEEPNGIGEALRNNRSPGLRKLQEVAPSRQRSSARFSLWFFGENHLAFRVADARMLVRQVIKSPPGDQPQESKNARNHKCHAPSPAQVHRQD